MLGRLLVGAAVHSFLLCAFCFVVMAVCAPRTNAQCAHPPRLQVRGGSAECLTEAALRQRVAAYSAQSQSCGARDMALSLQLMAADRRALLVVERAGTPIASRQFEALPEDCDELRDMLALSIAMALEHAKAAVEPAHARERRAPKSVTMHAAKHETSHGTQQAEKLRGVVSASPESPSEISQNALSGSELASVEKRSNAASAQAGAESALSAYTPEAASSAAAADPSASVEKADSTKSRSSASPATPGRADGAASDAESATTGPHNVWRVYAGGQAVLFAWPTPLWLGAAGLELMRGAFSVQLGGIGGGVAGLPVGRGRADLRLAGAELYGCGGANAADLQAQLCLGVLGAALFAHGDGFAPNLGGRSGWGAAAVMGAVHWPRSTKLALRLSIQGLLNVVRPLLFVEGTPQDDTLLASLGASARLELVFALP